MHFATKPALAARMISRALDAGVLVSWVAGDEVYGSNPHLRAALEHRQLGYVLAVACDHQITTRAGKIRADTLVKRLPKRAWQKLSAGPERRGIAPTTGPWPTSPTRGRATDTCSSAATAAPANSPSIVATRQPECRCPLS